MFDHVEGTEYTILVINENGPKHCKLYSQSPIWSPHCPPSQENSSSSDMNKVKASLLKFDCGPEPSGLILCCVAFARHYIVDEALRQILMFIHRLLQHAYQAKSFVIVNADFLIQRPEHGDNLEVTRSSQSTNLLRREQPNRHNFFH